MYSVIIYFISFICIFSVFWVELTFVLVKVMGFWYDFDIFFINLWFGIRISINDVLGLRFGFKFFVFLNIIVIVFGSNFDSSLLFIVILFYLIIE